MFRKGPQSPDIVAVVQGQLEVTTLKGTGAAANAEADLVERKPFFMLTLELPQARLFQDAVDKDIIPQVPPPTPSPPSPPAHPALTLRLPLVAAHIPVSRYPQIVHTSRTMIASCSTTGCSLQRKHCIMR